MDTASASSQAVVRRPNPCIAGGSTGGGLTKLDTRTRSPWLRACVTSFSMRSIKPDGASSGTGRMPMDWQREKKRAHNEREIASLNGLQSPKRWQMLALSAMALNLSSASKRWWAKARLRPDVRWLERTYGVAKASLCNTTASALDV